MYNIPLFDLNFGKEEECAVVETLKSKWISMGPKCMELEKKFAEMLNVRYACAVTNCTAALHLACCALGIREGEEVICPSLTFAATVNCIRYVGAVPVFADICGNDNLCISAKEIESLITEHTKAIILMHYAGFACDMDKIMEIAKIHNLHVIEDACHGPLSEYNGCKLGSIGDVGCFSFFSNKNISTGEGGMIVTNNEEIYNKVKLMRSHGMTTMSYQRASGHAVNYDIVDLGYNYRMDDIRASIGIAQLNKLRDDLKKRMRIREWYIEYLAKLDYVYIPFKDNDEFASNYIFPIVLKDSTAEKRDLLRINLQKKGIQTSIHYPAIHRFSAYKSFSRNLPNTEYVTDNEITLPMYAKLEKDQIKYICESLMNCYRE
ncbi:MAG: DegT/DnrJ/EryC1/StrS family aminotransferase [Lachnospiraceae bacterium]|nr:DegT/DnrJ/EryC1/StrS family aminotransferase [Lachnospiraceae bacterium]